MRIYLDSSALVPRVAAEPFSEALKQRLHQLEVDEALMVTSAVGKIEVSRALRSRAERLGLEWHEDDDREALSGVRILPLDDQVVEHARSIGPRVLRSLDAVHCATALLTNSDTLITYDVRLADAAVRNGISVESPGRAER